jgi:hypothetical protein
MVPTWTNGGSGFFSRMRLARSYYLNGSRPDSKETYSIEIDSNTFPNLRSVFLKVLSAFVTLEICLVQIARKFQLIARDENAELASKNQMGLH